MFDDLNDEQNNNQVVRDPKTPVVPNNFQPDKLKAEVVDDIFADTENDEKPQAFQANNTVADDQAVSVKSNNAKKILLLLGIFCGFVIICSAGYFTYVKLAKDDTAIDNPIEQSDDNTVVPEKKVDDPVKKEELRPVEPTPVEEDKPAEEKQEVSPIDDLDEPEIEEEATDSDNDGLSDFEESILGTNINNADTDADGVSDEDEVQKYKTDPLSADTDNDGYLDGAEIESGYNPKGAGKMFK